MDRYGLHIRHPVVDCKERLQIDLLTDIKIKFFFLVQNFCMPKGCSQLRQKVTGSISIGVTGTFH